MLAAGPTLSPSPAWIGLGGVSDVLVAKFAMRDFSAANHSFSAAFNNRPFFNSRIGPLSAFSLPGDGLCRELVRGGVSALGRGVECLMTLAFLTSRLASPTLAESPYFPIGFKHGAN